jgi:cell division protein FtsB
MSSPYARYYTYLKPVMDNKQVKTYSSLAVSLVVTLLFGALVIKPTLAQIATLNSEIKQQQALLAQLRAKNNNLNQGIANYNQLDPSVIEKTDLLLPKKSNYPKLLNTLSTIASENQASVSGIQFQATELYAEPKVPSTNPQVIPVEFTLNIVSPFPKAAAVLDALRRADRLLYVDSISMNKPEDGQLITTITAKAYVLR